MEGSLMSSIETRDSGGSYKIKILLGEDESCFGEEDRVYLY